MRIVGLAIGVALAFGGGCSDDPASTGGTGSGGASTTTSATSNASTGSGSNFSCANPQPSWLLCEDFEAGQGDFGAWQAATDFLGGPGTEDRGRATLANDQFRSGGWSAFFPASPSSGYQGASLDWYACDGAQMEGCSLRSFDTLYFRVWVRFAEDHRYIHHFLSIGGSQPDDFWYHGTAGCMPNGSLDMGTTVDSRADTHESFFYTYYPGMACDTNCGNYADVNAICADCASKGLPTCDQQPQCCWGANIEPATPHAFPVGQWFCLEMMMQANTPSQPDGAMAYWVDGAEIHRETGMMFRTSPTLALNRVRVQHYITTEDAQGFSNRVWFDDVVVSTEPIGCD